jgi:2-polyprenyl-3-methyl-5-hydroxy-6-metoxy-1,4-benzoquinol methylase
MTTTIAAIEQTVLETVGFEDTSADDYSPKPVILRDGREAVVWVHRQTGHGILDSAYWEGNDFYEDNYRKEFSAKVGTKTDPAEHLRIYEDLNEKQFRSFAQHLKAKTKFLEIGCSFGGILNRVAPIVEHCHGIEPNKEDAAFVERRNKKAKIFNTTFEQGALKNGFYDVAVSIEVLEHTVSPREFLRKCYKVLKDKGILHLEVPNHNDVLLRYYPNTGYDKFYYHKAHTHYFTKDSLLALCRDCGFEGDVSSFLMYPFFNHVWWHQHRGPQSSGALALRTPQPAEDLTEEAKAINEFYRKAESDYEQLINQHVLGDCLIFQGKKVRKS